VALWVVRRVERWCVVVWDCGVVVWDRYQRTSFSVIAGNAGGGGGLKSGVELKRSENSREVA